MKRDHALFRTPTKLDRDSDGAPMRPEAIAMRRIVADAGAWLSPMLRDYPVPKLSHYELTVDLLRLDHNHAGRAEQERRASGIKGVGGGTGSQGTRPSAYRVETYAELQARTSEQRRKQNAKRGKSAHDGTMQTEDEIKEIERQRCAKRREKAKQQTAAFKAAQQREAVARIAAIAAQKAEAEAKRKAHAEQADARRQATAKRAADAYIAKLKSDPVKYAEHLAQRRATERERDAKRKAKAGVPQRIPNPHRDPTLPTARQLRDEAIIAEAIEAEQRARDKLVRLYEKARRIKAGG
jgi:colicin import membrane protein